jgi:hypothetical protein
MLLKNWKSGSQGRAPVSQVHGLEFKHQYYFKKKKEECYTNGIIQCLTLQDFSSLNSWD